MEKYLLSFMLLITNDDWVPDGKGGYLTPRGDKYWFGILPVIGVSWEF